MSDPTGSGAGSTFQSWLADSSHGDHLHVECHREAWNAGYRSGRADLEAARAEREELRGENKRVGTLAMRAYRQLRADLEAARADNRFLKARIDNQFANSQALIEFSDRLSADLTQARARIGKLENVMRDIHEFSWASYWQEWHALDAAQAADTA